MNLNLRKEIITLLNIKRDWTEQIFDVGKLNMYLIKFYLINFRSTPRRGIFWRGDLERRSFKIHRCFSKKIIHHLSWERLG